MRLDKMLSHKGYGSRKEVKTIIRKGFVYVNDTQIFDDDFKVDENKDSVTIMDEIIEYCDKVYIMLNKPKNVVSATFDFNKETVIDLVGSYAKQKVFPIGRLDIDTVGLLIITNDGPLAYDLISPKKHVDKVYYVEFLGEFKEEYNKMFLNGIQLEDGYICREAKIKLLNKNSCEITIHEGKFHQIKRMFDVLGMKVTYLKRIKFGNIELDESLKEGEFRLLTSEEVELLRKR